MEQQLDELKAKVEKSQQALVDYERQNAIVNISDKESVVEQRMADLSRDLTNAQSDRLQKESVYELVRSNESQVASVAQNDLLQHLEEKYADLKSQYVDALEQSGPKHPKAERLQSQVDEIQSLIERERKRIVERMRNDYMAALGRERLLAAAVAKEKVEVGALNQLLIQHNLLKRESETNQQLYDNLLQRLKDATVSAGLRATNIHVIDPAKPPRLPVRPQKLRNILIGLMVGLVLGLALAFVREAVDTSIKSVDEAERLANAPALAVVPLARDARRRPTPSLPGNNGKSSRNPGISAFESTLLGRGRILPNSPDLGGTLDGPAAAPGVIDDQLYGWRGEDGHLSQPGDRTCSEGGANPAHRCGPSPSKYRQVAQSG